jgi:hypothetical protein
MRFLFNRIFAKMKRMQHIQAIGRNTVEIKDPAVPGGVTCD